MVRLLYNIKHPGRPSGVDLHGGPAEAALDDAKLIGELDQTEGNFVPCLPHARCGPIPMRGDLLRRVRPQSRVGGIDGNVKNGGIGARRLFFLHLTLDPDGWHIAEENRPP